VQWGQSNWLAIVGGCILAGMGLKNLLQKPSKASLSPPDPNDATDRYGAIGKGFVLNTFNPGTSMVWLAAGTAGADLAAKGGLWLQGAYMATILATVLSTDLTKAYLAKKLKNHLTTRTIIYANRVAGAIMLVAGLVLIGVVVVKVF
jgi:threonine/homoserine/homoserine lactone efflux protein